MTLPIVGYYYFDGVVEFVGSIFDCWVEFVGHTIECSFPTPEMTYVVVPFMASFLLLIYPPRNHLVRVLFGAFLGHAMICAFEEKTPLRASDAFFYALFIFNIIMDPEDPHDEPVNDQTNWYAKLAAAASQDMPSTDPDHACVVCMERATMTEILPCGHACLCIQCALVYARKKFATNERCPICRGYIRELKVKQPTALQKKKRKHTKRSKTNKAANNN